MTRCGNVRSEGETRRALIVPERLLDDFGDDVESVPHRWSVCLVLLSAILFGDEVGAKRLGHVQWVGHRNHTAGVDCLHLFDERQNCRQFVTEPLNVTPGEMQARKVGDVLNAAEFE